MTTKASAKKRNPKPTTAEIRAWALKHYDGIGARGPIPEHVVTDFKKSQRDANR